MTNHQYNTASKSNLSDTMMLADFPLAMAYVPWQKNFDSIYDTDKALCAGTIFQCLDKPFLGRGGCK